MSDIEDFVVQHQLYTKKECRVAWERHDSGEMFTYLICEEDGEAIAEFSGELSEQQVFEVLMFANAAYSEGRENGRRAGRVEFFEEMMAEVQAFKDEMIKGINLERN